MDEENTPAKIETRTKDLLDVFQTLAPALSNNLSARGEYFPDDWLVRLSSQQSLRGGRKCVP